MAANRLELVGLSVLVLTLVAVDRSTSSSPKTWLLPEPRPSYARTNQYAEAADYWRRYLASDCQSEWAARARRSLKFCEIQINLIASA